MIDGFKLWKNILNIYRETSSEEDFNTIFKGTSSKYYDFSDDTIFIECQSKFIKELMENRLPKLYSIMKNQLEIFDIKIKPITKDEEIKNIILNSKEKDNEFENTIRAEYTFDTFVVGNSNKLAFASCVNVANNPSYNKSKDSFNPLFLYSGVGLGKTHLMHAIANRIKKDDSSKKILYVSSETFTNELISAIQEGKTKDFKDKYRSLDVILIDDIQFLKNKEQTQEEFFHTFNDLYNNDKQLIISSDRRPQELTILEDRLRSRFEMGLTVDIQPPDFETRVAILKKKCQIDEKNINDDVLALIATNIKSNIRELEGALNKVCAYSNLMKKEVTVELANEILKDVFDKKEKKEVNLEYIKEIVANYFSITIKDLESSKRSKNIAYPRQIAMYLAKEFLDIPLVKIGEGLGNRDHTTVLHGVNKINSDIKVKKENVDITVNKLIEEIKK